MPQLTVLHSLLLTPTIPPCVCCAQYSAVFVPATLNNRISPQPSVLHFLLQTSTTPSGACSQYSTICVQLRTAVRCRRRSFSPVRAAHSTPLVLYLPLRTMESCRSLRFCTFCCRRHNPFQGVLCTVLRRYRTCNPERRFIATAFCSALSVVDDDHLVRCVMRTVLHRFCTCHSERWNLAAAFGSALSDADVDYSFQGVLFTVLRRFRTCNSQRRVNATAFGCARFVVDVTIPPVACCAQYSAVFVPATPNDGRLP